MTIFMVGSLPYDLFSRGYHVVYLETEFLQHRFQRSGCAKSVHANALALGADIALPTKRGGHFHGNSGCNARGKNALFIAGVLLLEELPGWHAHDTGFDPFGLQLFIRLHTELNLAAAAHQDHIGLSTTSIC